MDFKLNLKKKEGRRKGGRREEEEEKGEKRGRGGRGETRLQRVRFSPGGKAVVVIKKVSKVNKALSQKAQDFFLLLSLSISILSCCVVF